MKSHNRVGSQCPICQSKGRTLRHLIFSEHRWLPAEISLTLCDTCDFAFTSPADAEKYENYYAATMNDLLFQDGSSKQRQERYRTQAGILSHLLVEQKNGRVLDVGCGSGGLLRELQSRFHQHCYHGVDPNVVEHVSPEGISFSQSWQALEGEYDLIILSHALEHIVDLAGLSGICRLLAPGGLLYIEVPDASRYVDFPRREYLYYIDRLHINHFTRSSLRHLLEGWGLDVTRSGLHDFEYKDLQPYPACYVLATCPHTPLSAEINTDSISVAMERYLREESARAVSWRQRLGQDADILVYGFGDNFFRAVNADGPLSKCRIRAVVDKRWRELNKSRYAESYTFTDLDTVLESHAHLPIVVTVSWQGENIAQELIAAGCKQVFIL